MLSSTNGICSVKISDLSQNYKSMIPSVIEFERPHNFQECISNDGVDTESKRVAFLEKVQESLKRTGGRLVYDKPLDLIYILNQALSDELPSTRCTAMTILIDAIPLYGMDLDSHLKLLFPGLLENLVNRNPPVKRCALQVLHLYFKRNTDKSLIIDNLICHGFTNRNKVLRNEIFLTVPALVRSGFNKKHLKELFISVLRILPHIDDADSKLPVLLCLEHMKDCIGEDFTSFLASLEKNLIDAYQNVMLKTSFSRKEKGKLIGPENSPSNFKEYSQADKKEVPNDLVFGFLPRPIMDKLNNRNNMQECSDACNDFIKYLSSADVMLVQSNAKSLLDIINILLEESNLIVALPALTLLHKTVTIIGHSLKEHLDILTSLLLKKMNDPRVVLRKLNLCIGLTIMHSFSPDIFLQTIIPHLSNRNTRIREEILNMIIAALLTFPATHFNLKQLSSQVTYCLLDKKKRVRHACLECLAVLAQCLGAGHLKPLVLAVDNLESQFEGVLAAVQARLRRSQLPSINEEGIVQYALVIHANMDTGSYHSPDVAWILSGTVVNSSDNSESSFHRHLSAGKKKLPWQNDTQEINSQFVARNTAVRSAPVYKISNEALVNEYKTSDSLNDGNMRLIEKAQILRNESDTDQAFSRSESSSSYFEMYKTKMKQIKAAGLQADVNALQSVLPNNSGSNIHPPGLSKNNLKADPYLRSSFVTSPTPLSPINFGASLSPLGFQSAGKIQTFSDRQEHDQHIPVKPTLARSASSKRHNMCASIKNEDFVQLEDLAHTLPKCRSQLRRVSVGSMESPFPLRPTIHRTPSGRLTGKSVLESQHPSESSNLQMMKKLSISSPVVSANNFTNTQPITSEQLFSLLEGNIKSPLIKTPRARVMKSPIVSDFSSISQRICNLKTEGETVTSSEKSHFENQINVSPRMQKFPKSGQDPVSAMTTKDPSLAANNHPYEMMHLSDDNNNTTISSTLNEITVRPKSKDLLKRERELKKFKKHQKNLQQQESKMQEEVRLWKESETQRKEEDKNYNKLEDTKQSYVVKKVGKSKSQGYSGCEEKNDCNDFSPEVNDMDKISTHENSPMAQLNGGRSDEHNDLSFRLNITSPISDKNKTSGLATQSKIPPRKHLQPIENPSVATHKNHRSHSPVDSKIFTEEADTSVNGEYSVTNALQLLRSGQEDWEYKCEGIAIIRQLLKSQQDAVHGQFHAIIEAVLNEVKNLRSQVTRAALGCVAEVFEYMPKMAELEAEIILKVILLKAADTNQFIRQDVDVAMANLVLNVNPSKAMSAIIAVGISHRNGQIRKICAKAIADIAEKIGSSRILSIHKDILAVSAKLATDSQQDSRYHGRRILNLLLDYPDLDKMIIKDLPTASVRAVQEIIENLRQKGLGEPPSGSATARFSLNSSGISPRKSSRVHSGDNSQDDIAKPTQRKRKTSLRENVRAGQVIDLEPLKKLESADWSERYSGLDDFYNLVSMSPSAVSAQAVKIFDKFSPRLCDPNSKVSLYALHTLNRCIPILRNGISPAATILIENLKILLASKNDAIFSAAKDCMITLTKLVDNNYLVLPLATAVQYSNTRNRPELTDRLNDIIPTVFARKPGAVHRVILPVLWKLLAMPYCNESPPGHISMHEVLIRLCRTLHDCIGEELLSEAASKEPVVLQQIEELLG